MTFMLLLLLGFAVVHTSPKTISTRIYGGRDCHNNEAPYYVGVESDGGFCGGSLLSDTWVLTAAHCLGPNLRVLIGLRNSGTGPLHTISISTIHLPPGNQQMDNDIALLELNPPFANVTTVHLPTRCNPNNNPPQNTDLLVAGLGSKAPVISSLSNLKYPTTLQCVTLKVQTCPPHLITADIFCAGDRTHRIGRGDSGGALVFNNGGTPEVYGLVCCGSNSLYDRLLNHPNFYTNVCTHLPWIRRVTNPSIG